MTISLQSCTSCSTIQYPTRAVCRQCLSPELEPVSDPGTGELLSTTLVHRSLEPQFAPFLPLAVGTILLDCGVRVISFLDAGLAIGARVRLRRGENARGEPVWQASAETRNA